jgi:hypothetical protein
MAPPLSTPTTVSLMILASLKKLPSTTVAHHSILLMILSPQKNYPVHSGTLRLPPQYHRLVELSLRTKLVTLPRLYAQSHNSFSLEFILKKNGHSPVCLSILLKKITLQHRV